MKIPYYVHVYRVRPFSLQLLSCQVFDNCWEQSISLMMVLMRKIWVKGESGIQRNLVWALWPCHNGQGRRMEWGSGILDFIDVGLHPRGAATRLMGRSFSLSREGPARKAIGCPQRARSMSILFLYAMKPKAVRLWLSTSRALSHP